jgi:hypothetical protein
MSIGRYLGGRVGVGQVGNQIYVSTECSFSNWRTYYSLKLRGCILQKSQGVPGKFVSYDHMIPLLLSIQIYSFELQGKCMP